MDLKNGFNYYFVKKLRTTVLTFGRSPVFLHPKTYQLPYISIVDKLCI